ncbi:MAG: hypothetical protein B9S32_08330 [Verrucomicrobia bacterium Tous-C9LFEB]|nr:MAG: hypothetical protein B9S32_08330 [Verrucomicrobia bacterium Tous-C9LFEB]
MIGIVIMIVLGMVVSMAFGFAGRTKWWHWLSAALVSSFLFQVIVFVQLGYMDPFAPIAFIVTTVGYLVLSGVIFAVFKSIRH